MRNHNQKKTVYYFKTDGPNIKTGGLTGYNREIRLFEALNLWPFFIISVDSLMSNAIWVMMSNDE